MILQTCLYIRYNVTRLSSSSYFADLFFTYTKNVANFFYLTISQNSQLVKKLFNVTVRSKKYKKNIQHIFTVEFNPNYLILPTVK